MTLFLYILFYRVSLYPFYRVVIGMSFRYNCEHGWTQNESFRKFKKVSFSQNLVGGGIQEISKMVKIDSKLSSGVRNEFLLEL